MNKKTIMRKLFIAFMTGLVLLVGCKKETVVEGPGELSLAITYDGSFTEMPGLKSRAVESAGPQVVQGVDMSRFLVKLTRPVHGWTRTYVFGDMPEILELVPGHYTIEVTSPDQAPAKFEQPIFGGESEFDIETGKVAAVSIVCTIKNVKVTFNPSENFNKELADYSVKVSNGVGAFLLWTKQDILDGKAGFFTLNNNPFEIHVDGVRAIDDTTPATFDAQIKGAQARDHIIVKLDAQSTGALSGIQLSVDTSTNNRHENVVVPGFDETPIEGVPGGQEGGQGGDTPEVPEVTGLSLVWNANPSFGEYPLKNTYNEGEVTMYVNADNFLQGFTVKIESETPGFLGAVKEIAGSIVGADGSVTLDLFNPETASSLPFLPCGDQLLDKASIEFPLTDLLPLILAFSPDNGSRHTFTLTVTDKIGQVLSKELVFVYNN